MTQQAPTIPDIAAQTGAKPTAKPTLIRGGMAGKAILAAWILSILYHAVLFVVMYLLPWLAGMAKPVSDAPIPTADLLSPVETKVTMNQPSTAPKAEQILPDPMSSMTFKPDKFERLDSIGTVKPNDLNILGVGTGGSDQIDGGFSMPIGGSGPNFFGLGEGARGARNIVYVVDRSGSMLNTFQGLVKEIKESVNGLRRSQRFHVIFYNSGPPLENPPRKLVSAIRSQKRNLFRFLDEISPMGGTDPRPAMRRAFAVEPDLIYFLSDGEFDEHAESLMSMIDKLNRGRLVRIFTIAYVNQHGGAVLERIAREHNGQYRFVTEDEIFD